jgi:hypothetical protein
MKYPIKYSLTVFIFHLADAINFLTVQGIMRNVELYIKLKHAKIEGS